VPESVLESSHEHPVLLQVLYNRGLRDKAEVASFLQGEDAVQENPFRLTDMSAAVARIVRAIETREVICVYGDFDADGVTATVLMTTALQRAGALVGAYIPNRVDEGYGLNVEALRSIAGKGADLLVAECYFHQKPVPWHLNYPELSAHKADFDARRIVLTHMSPEMLAHVDDVPEECAYDGMVVEF